MKKHKLCFNCLGAHSRRQCPSKRTCQSCKQQHNTLLHDSFDAAPPGPVDSADVGQNHAPASVPTASSHCTQEGDPDAPGLMTTALVSILSPTGARFQTRALLDSASDVSFVSEDVVQRLGLSRYRSSLSVLGVGANKTAHPSHYADIRFSATTRPDELFHVRAFVLPRISSDTPVKSAKPIDPKLLNGLQLADPEYYRAQKIGLLLGAKIYGLLFRDGTYKVPGHPVMALNTVLGWVLSGALATPGPQASAFCCQVVDNLDFTLRRFKETEEIPAPAQSLSPEDEDCEFRFRTTCSRNDIGRFMVRLPRRATVEHGDNR